MKHSFALPCPFCGSDPGLARVQLVGSIVTYQVGCESDECWINPQLSAHSYADAWARWNERHVAPVTQLEQAGAGGFK